VSSDNGLVAAFIPCKTKTQNRVKNKRMRTDIDRQKEKVCATGFNKHWN
jgi:hypothetical protein